MGDMVEAGITMLVATLRPTGSLSLPATSHSTTDISLPNQTPNRAPFPPNGPSPAVPTTLPVQTPQPVLVSPFTQPQSTPKTPNIQSIPGVGSVNVANLEKLLALLEGSKTVIPAQALSPFSTVVKKAPFTHGYRNTSDLHYHENSNTIEFLGRFGIEVDVY